LLLDPIAWLIIIAFSVLGSLGNLALYQVGKQGVDAIRKRFLRIRDEHWLRVKHLYDKYGGWVLLLSGVPVLGSLLTTAAGAAGDLGPGAGGFAPTTGAPPSGRGRA
jgi:membrane protein YqaA with SNARE-associated domain